MTHGDDKGLRLPPNIAPIQVCSDWVEGKQVCGGKGGRGTHKGADSTLPGDEQQGMHCGSGCEWDLTK